MATQTEPPVVLVVDDDESARRLVRMGLELEGITVVEADTLARARQFLHRNMAGVVLDRELPDGDGLTLLADIGATCPDANVVVNSTVDDGREPAWVAKVDKGDVPGIVRCLDLGRAPRPEERLAVIDLVRAEADGVVADWQELCRWDPLLPPGTEPPLADLVVDAVADALQRPQPLGWGADPALTSAMELFAAGAGAIDVAVEQLICLREAFRRHLSGHVPPDEERESVARVDMLVDRAIWTACRVARTRLQTQTGRDPFTGLGDRDRFDVEIEAELERAERYGRALSVVLLGPPDGSDVDAALAAIGGAVAMQVRRQDRVFRYGPAVVAVLLPEVGTTGAAAVIERLEGTVGAVARGGAATFPDDGDDVTSLLREADHRRMGVVSIARGAPAPASGPGRSTR